MTSTIEKATGLFEAMDGQKQWSTTHMAEQQADINLRATVACTQCEVKQART